VSVVWSVVLLACAPDPSHEPRAAPVARLEAASPVTVDAADGTITVTGPTVIVGLVDDVPVTLEFAGSGAYVFDAGTGRALVLQGTDGNSFPGEEVVNIRPASERGDVTLTVRGTDTVTITPGSSS
jgi:hypothetical protein